MPLLDPQKETEEFGKLLDNGFYRECCNNCKHKMKLVKFDYSQVGCEHSDYDGFACTLFASEGEVVHMVGNNPETAHCECFTRRKMKVEYSFRNFVELGLDDNCSECKFSRRKSDKEPCMNCSPQHCAWEPKKVKE